VHRAGSRVVIAALHAGAGQRGLFWRPPLQGRINQPFRAELHMNRRVTMPRSPRLLLSLLLLLLAAFAAPAARAQRAGEASTVFDPKSGRFGSGLGEESGRVPDTLAVSAAKVWAALPAVYEELGVPLTVVDSASLYLGSVRVTTRRPVGGLRLSMILECGTGNYGPNAERYTVQLTVVSGVRSLDAGHSTIETRVVGSASQNGLSNSVKCGTNGMLEEKIVNMLRDKLGH